MSEPRGFIISDFTDDELRQFWLDCAARAQQSYMDFRGRDDDPWDFAEIAHHACDAADATLAEIRVRLTPTKSSIDQDDIRIGAGAEGPEGGGE